MQDFEKDVEAKENHIKDILEKTENDIKEGKIMRRSAEGGAEEFVFAADGTGLVFDQEAPPAKPPVEGAAREPVAQHEKNAPRVEDVTLVSRTENTSIPFDRPVDTEEFSLPSSFKVDKKYNTPVVEERRPMYSAYIPKFTDASENYRMADQAHAKKEEPEAQEPSVDPTAEEETETNGNCA